MHLLPFNDGLERNITFEFISDGSVQGRGFSFKFFPLILCECADNLIKCDSLDHTFVTGGGYSICGGMRCNFTLGHCITEHSLLTSNVQAGSYDLYRVISDETIILDLAAENQDVEGVRVVLNTTNKNVIEIITNSMASGKNIYFTLRPFEIPPIIDVELTAMKPYVITDMSFQQCVFYQISEDLQKENLSLVFFDNFGYEVSIYNDKSFSKILFDFYCFGNDNHFRCDTKRTHFLACNLFYHVAELDDDCDTDFPFFAVRLAEKIRGCVFKENVFIIRGETQEQITAVSTPDDECDVIVLINPKYSYIMKNVWTTSKNETVKIYFGENREKLFFEFNSISAPNLHFIGLHSKAFSIKIPKGASLLITLTTAPLNVQSTIPIEFPDSPFNSFVATPNFGTSKKIFCPPDIFGDKMYNGIFSIFKANNLPVTFIVIDFKMYPGDFFSTNATNLKVSGVGDYFTIKNEVISFNYSSALKETVDGGILFFITTDIKMLIK